MSCSRTATTERTAVAMPTGSAPGCGFTRATPPRIRFEWLLPGHGDRRRLAAADMARRLQRLPVRARELSPQSVDFTALRW
jgi:hypothetical protein